MIGMDSLMRRRQSAGSSFPERAPVTRQGPAGACDDRLGCCLFCVSPERRVWQRQMETEGANAPRTPGAVTPTPLRIAHDFSRENKMQSKENARSSYAVF